MAPTDDRTVISHSQFCSQCGAEVHDARFCPQCGALVNADPPVASPPAAAAIPEPRRKRPTWLLAAGGLGLVAIAIAAIIISTSGGGSQPASAQTGQSTAGDYRAKLAASLSPVITANSQLSTALGNMDGSRPTITAARNAATAVESAITTAKGATGVLSVPTSQATLSQQTQQALTEDDGYVQAVVATLNKPVGQSSAQLQTLSTNAQTALVPVSSLVSGASSSVSNTANLLSWVDGANGIHSHSGSAGQSRSSTTTAAATPPPSGGGSGASNGSTDCGNRLIAGPNTSCQFAQNVQQAYYQAPGLVATVLAYSPVTNQTYSMSCAPAGSGTTCSGANNASVSW
jgi:hypothetical protein